MCEVGRSELGFEMKCTLKVKNIGDAMRCAVRDFFSKQYNFFFHMIQYKVFLCLII